MLTIKNHYPFFEAHCRYTFLSISLIPLFLVFPKKFLVAYAFFLFYYQQKRFQWDDVIDSIRLEAKKCFILNKKTGSFEESLLKKLWICPIGVLLTLINQEKEQRFLWLSAGKYTALEYSQFIFHLKTQFSHVPAF